MFTDKFNVGDTVNVDASKWYAGGANISIHVGKVIKKTATGVTTIVEDKTGRSWIFNANGTERGKQYGGASIVSDEQAKDLIEKANIQMRQRKAQAKLDAIAGLRTKFHDKEAILQALREAIAAVEVM